MTRINKRTPKLRKRPQAPPSRPGGVLDSDRAKSPRLAQPPAPDSELNPSRRRFRIVAKARFGSQTQANEVPEFRARAIKSAAQVTFNCGPATTLQRLRRELVSLCASGWPLTPWPSKKGVLLSNRVF
jgi:hypothetical protein